MKRRAFITLLGGATASCAAWPLAARAQQTGPVRRIGVLHPTVATDPDARARIAALIQGLAQLGWTDGRSVRIEFRWSGTNADDIRRHAAELAAFAPDVIVATSSPVVDALQAATRSVPIVFVSIADPVGAGFVDSLAQPGGNATGFTNFEYSIGGKWLELLKEIAPRLTRVAVLRDPTIAAGPGQFAAIQTAAPSFGVEVSPVSMRDAPEIERAVTAFARTANGGLIVTAAPLGEAQASILPQSAGY
jgi:putative ABC transport system substrate-binding protein